MAQVASQNRSWKDTGHVPSPDWPEDCRVQWGGGGVVIGRERNYRTAFFEAFPREGGFFRGEGDTIAAAEADCLAAYTRFAACEHRWGRKGYLNGGAICHECGAFKSVFNPVTTLGAHRAPLSILELESAMSGFLRPEPKLDREPRMRKHRRRKELRLRYFGVALPETPDTPQPEEYLFHEDRDPYIRACRRAVLTWYRDHRDDMVADAEGGMSGLFDGLSRHMLDRQLAEFESGDGGDIAPDDAPDM